MIQHRSPRSVGESGLDRGGGMEGSEHGNRADSCAGEFGRDVLRDAGKAKHIDVQHLAGSLRRFEIRARVIPEAEIQAFAGGRLLDHVGVTLELIADRRPDEIRAIRIEPVIHHQIDVAQVDEAEIDGDLFGFRRLRPQFLNIRRHSFRHPLTI
ncbi:hypothetical protein ABIC05_008045 [Bradyrhizobium sp. RT7a]